MAMVILTLAIITNNYFQCKLSKYLNLCCYVDTNRSEINHETIVIYSTSYCIS